MKKIALVFSVILILFSCTTKEHKADVAVYKSFQISEIVAMIKSSSNYFENDSVGQFVVSMLEHPTNFGLYNRDTLLVEQYMQTLDCNNLINYTFLPIDTNKNILVVYDPIPLIEENTAIAISTTDNIKDLAQLKFLNEEKWAEITEENISSTFVIAINGEVCGVYKVENKVGDGSCVVTLNKK